MTAATEALETALAEITAEALRDDCGFCWSQPGQPCATDHPGGTHVARYARAMRHSLILAADLTLVLDTLGVFDETSVLYPCEPVKRFSEPGAGWTLHERWLAGIAAGTDDERARYREYEAQTAKVPA